MANPAVPFTSDSEEALRGHKGAVRCLLESCDGSGRIASGSNDMTIIIWDPTKGKIRLNYSIPYRKYCDYYRKFLHSFVFNIYYVSRD